MAHVRFEVVRRFEAPPRSVWDELTDWAGHARWVPMTRVTVDPGPSAAVGTTFTAWTGLGPLALEDRMRVSVLDWDSAATAGRCEVVKLGPILQGRAEFRVTLADTASELRWTEDVTVPWVPQLLAPVVAGLGAAGFRVGMRRLAKILGDPRRPAGG